MRKIFTALILVMLYMAFISPSSADAAPGNNADLKGIIQSIDGRVKWINDNWEKFSRQTSEVYADELDGNSLVRRQWNTDDDMWIRMYYDQSGHLIYAEVGSYRAVVNEIYFHQDTVIASECDNFSSGLGDEFALCIKHAYAAKGGSAKEEAGIRKDFRIDNPDAIIKMGCEKLLKVQNEIVKELSPKAENYQYAVKTRDKLKNFNKEKDAYYLIAYRSRFGDSVVFVINDEFNPYTKKAYDYAHFMYPSLESVATGETLVESWEDFYSVIDMNLDPDY